MRRAPLLVLSMFASFAVACGGSVGENTAADTGSVGGDETSVADTGAPDTTPELDTDIPDTAPVCDPGAVSTTYPALHPAFPKLINAAGNSVLATPKVYLAFFAAYPYTDKLKTMAQTIGASAYWKSAVSEYGVGPITYVDAKILTETVAADITDKDVEKFVGDKITAGAFGTPDENTIYTIFYPQTTTITQSGGGIGGASKSCSSFGGYHSNVLLTIGGTTKNYAFAVIPTCATFGSLVGIDGVTGALSHEWAEAATDPYPSTNSGADSTYSGIDDDHFIWNLFGGAENGDLCAQRQDAFFKPDTFDFTVQSCWSNAAAKLGGDPCAPKAKGVFFNAAPVQNDKVTLDLSALGGGSVRTKGILIPTGGSVTVEVDLFSDGDTKGAWKVDAIDAIARFTGGKPTLDFAWDRKSGQNGEKLCLTLSVIASSPFGKAHPFIINSSKGGITQSWPALASE